MRVFLGPTAPGNGSLVVNHHQQAVFRGDNFRTKPTRRTSAVFERERERRTPAKTVVLKHRFHFAPHPASAFTTQSRTSPEHDKVPQRSHLCLYNSVTLSLLRSELAVRGGLIMSKPPRTASSDLRATLKWTQLMELKKKTAQDGSGTPMCQQTRSIVHERCIFEQ